MKTKGEISAALRKHGFDVQAAELDEASTPAAIRVALEAASSFLAGYMRALAKHASSADFASECPEVESLEASVLRYHAELSAKAHLEGRST